MSGAGVNLRALLGEHAPNLAARHMVEDSRTVERGDLFVACRGAVHDGHDHAGDAVARGAVAVLAERDLPGLSVPVIVLPELRSRRGTIAAAFYGQPSTTLHCVGVTGTNGKTSIAWYVADLASRLGHRCGYLGTLGWGAPPAVDSGRPLAIHSGKPLSIHSGKPLSIHSGKPLSIHSGEPLSIHSGEPLALHPARLTTEDAITVQRRLAALRDQGCTWVALEASSHALAQGRVDEVAFDVAAFTNLTRDHLDYHESFEAYGAAKARLFAWPTLKAAAINVDDPFGAQLAGRLDPAVAGLRIGVSTPGADVRWSGLAFDDQGAMGRWHTPWGEADFRLPVHSEFSVTNVATAVAVLGQAGVALADIVAAGATLAQVPGRMEFFRAPGRPAVVVDFAHTPDALDKVLGSLRRHTRGALICVFGCGGDRDAGKRPLMAAAAEHHADVLWLTSDNPRSEDPERIIADMRAGLSGRRCVHASADRRDAIVRAIAGAGEQDVVLVAGKGHEEYQEAGGRRVPFSDRALVAELMEGAA